MLGYGDFDTTMNVRPRRWSGALATGEQFTAADVVIGANIRFGMMFAGAGARFDYRRGS
jgi:glutathione S-transferase